MIRIRAPLSAAIAVGGVVLAFGAASADDPGAELAARRMVVARAERTLDALDALDAAIDPGFRAARRGAARVVSGTEPPGSELRRAADRLASADAPAAETRSALTALNAALGAWHPSAMPLPMPLAAGELASIGAQLAGSAAAADAFAAMRLRAAQLLADLDAALEAIADGSVTDAAELVARARAHHAALTAWEVELVTLPIWLETTDEMIGTMETMVRATRSGDAPGASAAAERFAALADEAGTADRALRIAMDEGGSAVTAAPLSRLSGVLSAMAVARSSVTSVRETSDR